MNKVPHQNVRDDDVYKKLLIGLLALGIPSLWADNMVNSREGRFLGGLHGGSYNVQYNEHVVGTRDEEDDFFQKPFSSFGGGVHIGGDWSSPGNVYLAAFLGYTYLGISKTKSVGSVTLSQSMKNAFFFDVNIGGGNTSCFYLILGVQRVKEIWSVDGISTPLGSLSLDAELSLTRPRFGLGSRFMLSDNIAMSANLVCWADTDLWKKREVKASLAGETHTFSADEKKVQGLDKDSSGNHLLGYNFSLSVSYALPVRSVFG